MNNNNIILFKKKKDRNYRIIQEIDNLEFCLNTLVSSRYKSSVFY